MLQPYLFESQFTDDLSQWMEARFLVPILDQEWGWEYWIQIDFLAWIDSVNRIQYDFRREVSRIIEGTRLDWLINSNSPAYTPIAVQIKAQTPKYVNSKFIADVKKDIANLQKLPGKNNKAMLAAVVDGGAETALISLGFQLLYEYPSTSNPLTKFYLLFW